MRDARLHSRVDRPGNIEFNGNYPEKRILTGTDNYV